jgi:hypothetical protein
MRLIIVLAALLSSAASAAETNSSSFDLDCAGQRLETSKKTASPFSMSYRVDLSQNEYCYGKCEKTFPIVSVSPLEIVLRDETDRFGGSSRYVLNRVEGTLSAHVLLPIPNAPEVMQIDAVCTRKSFSGFPIVKF